MKEKFNGLIITDDISMLGLRNFYSNNLNRIYVDLIKAGNDIILDLIPGKDNEEVYNNIIERIKEVEKAIKSGEVSEERINESVRKILKFKGYIVLN